MNKIRIIALDVDGTLLYDDHSLSERNRSVLAQAQDLGIRVVLCTGRGPMNTLPLLDQIGIRDGVVITHNGASTVDANRKVLHEYSFEFKELLPLMDHCRKEGIHLDVSTTFDLHVEALTERTEQMYHKFGIRPVLMKDWSSWHHPVVKCTVFGDKLTMDQLESQPELFPTGLRSIRSGERFIDIMHASATKGAALQELASRWGIQPSEVLSMGNYYNDIEMLQWAGVGIAVGNAPDGVKAVADEVCCSNNEDAVYHMVNKYVMGWA